MNLEPEAAENSPRKAHLRDACSVQLTESADEDDPANAADSLVSDCVTTELLSRSTLPAAIADSAAFTTDCSDLSASAKSTSSPEPTSTVDMWSPYSMPMWHGSLDAPALYHFDKKHLFHLVYYLAGAVSALLLVTNSDFPPLLQFCMFALQAGLIWMVVISVVAFRMMTLRPIASDFAYDFSPPVRAGLRCFALGFPIPFIIAAACAWQADGLYQDGNKAFQAGHYDQSDELMARSQAMNPFREQTIARRAYINNYRADYDRALSAASAAVEMKPGDGDAWASKAWALNQLGKYSDALAAAREAVELSPGNGESFAALSDAYLGLNMLPEAKDAALEHIRLHDRESVAYNKLATVLETMHRYNEAEQVRTIARNGDYDSFSFNY